MPLERTSGARKDVSGTSMISWFGRNRPCPALHCSSSPAAVPVLGVPAKCWCVGAPVPFSRFPPAPSTFLSASLVMGQAD